MNRLVVLALIAAGCQGAGSDLGRGSGSGSSAAPVTPPSDSAPLEADASAGSGSDEALHPKADEPEPPDPSKLIADLGATSAWQVVVDRSLYLARRGQHGVAYGTIGPAILVPAPPPTPTPGIDAGPAVDAGVIASPYVWLVDDTEGNGSLGIRVLLGAKGISIKEGDRVALGGAWVLDDERRWYWKVDGIDKLPPLDAAKDLKDPRPPMPGHVVANGELPQGARTISLARDNDAVYFQIVGPAPTTEGDGWAVADELGNPVFALMNLPGERASYGGQDMRTSDERWTLRRGVTYWVRIGKVRRKGLDKPANVNARTAPVRVL